MKKIILTLLSFVLFTSVTNAVECTPSQKSDLQTGLGNLTYTLTYLDNYMDMNGDFQEGYFKLAGLQIPENYYAATTVEDGIQMYDIANGLYLKGGVYEIDIYHTSCTGSVKTIEIKVPAYKQYCNLNTKCVSDDVWFDGTNENKTVNQIIEEKTGINTKLIIVLISLVVIVLISALIILIVRRRHRL